METGRLILCDTDVIIEFYKNNALIIDELKTIGQPNIAISTITAGELYFGAKNKKELTHLKKDINSLYLLDIDKSTCNIFFELMLKYVLSHKLAIPDAFIAATAISNKMKLFTLNMKDFKYISELEIYQH
ncbi:MAG: type II toxin-antitoxin system VapC family toxin [Bacteroidales bacterium]|nr:type II toxin-antitoxin system VapC family toxin [Bacteroidales bacterium]MCF8345283.1 type II toxin-antitoxin system VapC family toxin [Bacteroidales bacterium]MCF8349769.1 type II toxin-antitoxin system VapC family toxin [Bacteroidales bacterium]MCF8376288.1 type II toxin-antitoxin system VapC family toxin [Bacteroidales bacterium]